MLINTFLTEKEKTKMQNEIINYFENGYQFEEFLKEYLIKIGLDEVEVTKRSRDGGIDLKAQRKGVGNFDDIDVTHYYIQAKKYNINNKVNVKSVRELKGTMPFGYRGMLITTSSFTNDCISEAKNDVSKLLVLVDGETLINSCIENQIGFVYKPIFSKDRMDKFWKETKSISILNNSNTQSWIEKSITKNDIRARIISIPSSILNKIPKEINEIEVIINDMDNFRFSINRTRNYFGGVTKFLKEYKLLSQDGVIEDKYVKWYYDENKQIVKLKIVI